MPRNSSPTLGPPPVDRAQPTRVDAPHWVQRVLTRRLAPFIALLPIVVAVLVVAFVGDGERNAQPTDTYPSGAGSAQAVELAQSLPQAEGSALVVLDADSGRLSSEALDQVRALAVDLAGSDAEPIVAPDGTVAIFPVPLAASDDAGLTREVGELRDELNDATPPGVRAAVTGPAAVTADIDAVFDGANTKLLAATALVVAFLLVLTYRSPVLWVIPLVVIGVADRFAAVVATQLMAGLDVAFDDATTSILSILVFGAGTDYALLLISRYRSELVRHESRYAAMAVALRRTAEAVLSSAVTVVLGVLTLLLSLTPSTRALGVASAIGIGVASVFVLVVLPAALVCCGRWVFWPRVPRAVVPMVPEEARDEPSRRASSTSDEEVLPGSLGSRLARRWGALRLDQRGEGAGSAHGVSRRRWRASSTAGGRGLDELDQQSTLWGRVGGLVSRRPKSVVVVSLLLVGVMSSGTLGINLGLDNAEAFKDAPESVVAAERLAESFPAGTSDPVQVLTRGDAGAVAATAQGVDGVDSARVAAQGGGVSQVDVVLSAAPGSEAAQDAVRDLRTALDADGDSTDTAVGGTEALALDRADSTRRDLLVIVPVLVLLVMLVLGGLLRSVVAPVVLVATVVATYAAALGASWWVFGLLGYDGLDTNVPIIAFVFLVALGVDYNIFLVTRTREETAALGSRGAMLHALAATGGVITSAGILLAAVFTVLGQLPAVGLAEIGIVICLGVLLDTFVVRTVLVPALAYLLGDRFWWPRRIDTTSTAPTTERLSS